MGKIKKINRKERKERKEHKDFLTLLETVSGTNNRSSDTVRFDLEDGI
jgi:hypothetical protein